MDVMKVAPSCPRLNVTGGTRFLLLTFSFGVLLSSIAAADVFLVRVSRFLEQEVLDTCNERILLADEDGDGTLDSSEFIALVETLSEGAISVGDIAELPLRLRTVFYLTACLCALQPGAESDCCVGDNAEIPIEEVDSENSTVKNRVFCRELVQGIEDVKEGHDLTPAPASASPTVASTSTSASPTMLSSPSTSASPTMMSSPSTMAPSQNSTDAPSPSPVPPETECIGFQYQVTNNQSLTADDIMNEVDNSLKSGLIEATRTTVINILNETYPRSNGESFLPPSANEARKSIIAGQDNVEYMGQVMYYSDKNYRKLLQAAEEADAFVMNVNLATYRKEMEDDMSNILKILSRSRRLLYMHDDRSFLRHTRRLVYYSDEFPVEITQIVDSTFCPGQIANDFINCAVVSSNVCVVLEEGDNPIEVRATIVDGLKQAFTNGDFANNIPSGSRRMRR